MNQIEGILFESDSLSNHNQPVSKYRIKMGEVFQLPNERYALVCIRCSEEFQYFSEFTLHVQDHLLQMNVQVDEMVTINTDSIKIEIETNENIPGYSIKSDTVTEEPKSIGLSSFSQKQNIEANFKNDIDYSDADLKFFLDVSIDDNLNVSSCNEQEEIPTVISNQENTKKLVIKSTTKSKSKRKRKAKTTQRSTKIKRLKLESIGVANAYEDLLAKYKESIEDPMDPIKFEIFKAEKVDGLFPCTIKDTAEVRFLAALSLHSFKYEKVDKEHLCPVCKAPFPNPASVRRHVFSHVKEKVFLCGFCEQKFRTIRYLRGHLKEKHQNEKRQFECFLCHKQFLHNQFRAMKNHIQSHQFANLHCILCNKKFKEYRFYQLHMINIHPHGFDLNNQNRQHQEPIDYRPKPVITSFECYLCGKSFRERRLLRSHMKLHIQLPRLCLVCGIFCSSATSLSRHMKLHDSDETKSHFCNICNKGFKVRQYLLRHNRKEHGIWADNTPPKCSVCGQEFEKKPLLHEHMKTHPFEETRNFICKICNHAAKNAYNLKRHMQTHSNDRSFTCDICAKTFHPRYAKDHMKSHTEAPKHKCKICAKRFKRAYALKQHMYQHGGVPEHKCDICGKAFARTDKLLRHRRRHGIPLNYHCKICLKGFISQKSYLLHESSHMKEQTSNQC